MHIKMRGSFVTQRQIDGLLQRRAYMVYASTYMSRAQAHRTCICGVLLHM
jgi:hypothetical protein